MAICYAFMIPVDGWLTKQSAPIVLYRPDDTSGISPDLGHPAGGVRLRLRAPHPRDARLGPPRGRRSRARRATGRGRMSSLLLALGAFVAMEAVSYATHRWVMHGFGHGVAPQPPRAGHEPVRAQRPVPRSASPSWASCCSPSLVGLARVLVGRDRGHGLRRRLPVRARGVHPPPPPRAGAPDGRYLEWLRESHRAHHLTGAEPYGMLLPLGRAETRTASAPTTRSSAPSPA